MRAAPNSEEREHVKMLECKVRVIDSEGQLLRHQTQLLMESAPLAQRTGHVMHFSVAHSLLGFSSSLLLRKATTRRNRSRPAAADSRRTLKREAAWKR